MSAPRLSKGPGKTPLPRPKQERLRTREELAIIDSQIRELYALVNALIDRNYPRLEAHYKKRLLGAFAGLEEQQPTANDREPAPNAIRAGNAARSREAAI